MNKKLNVAVPWHVSDYLPLNGFHPLYKSLFTTDKNNKIVFNIYDEYSTFLDYKSKNLKFKNQIVQFNKKYIDHLSLASKNSMFNGDEYIIENLPGEIEFHHSSVVTNLKRPFILHLEVLSTLFLPDKKKDTEFISYKKYKKLLENDLCLGVFSHLKETLENINNYFNSEKIYKKLYLTKIGIETKNELIKEKEVGQNFLFINSNHQNDKNFFSRGGMLILESWEKILKINKKANLYMRCEKPHRHLIKNPDVLRVLDEEEGKSIHWFEDYLSKHEMDNLFKKSNFFFLVSDYLHSASIMQALQYGLIIFSSDTIGVNNYIKHKKNGLVINGKKDEFWKLSENVMIEKYSSLYKTDHYTKQIISLYKLCQNQNFQKNLSKNALNSFKKNFMGNSFKESFFNQILEKYETYYKKEKIKSSPSNLNILTTDSILHKKSIESLFNSPPQPNVYFLKYKKNVIFQLRGLFFVIDHNNKFNIKDWNFLNLLLKDLIVNKISPIKHISNLNLFKSYDEAIKFISNGKDPEKILSNFRFKRNNILYNFKSIIASRLRKYPKIFRLVRNSYHALNDYRRKF